MTVSYPQPIVSTLPVLVWYKLVVFVMVMVVLITYAAAVDLSTRNFIAAAFPIAFISGLWYRCWAELKRLERDHTVPNVTMVFLFDLLLQLPLVQMFIMVAVARS